jgi:hypothetical protein
MRASHDHYPVPLSRRAVGRVLEIQAGAMGLVVRDYLAVNRRIYPSRHFSRFLIISRRRGAPAPFQYKVTQLQASLAAAKQQVEILKSNYEQATANVSGLTTQVAYNKKRLADIQTLAAMRPARNFRRRINKSSTRRCRRSSAPPRPRSRAKTRTGFRDRRRQHHGRAASGAARQRKMGIVPDGRSRARQWVCHRRRIDHRRSGAAGTLGDVVHCREGDHAGRHVFAERLSGHQGRRGRRDRFDNAPGRIYRARITAIPKGIGQGQIAVSGTLARTNALGGATVFPAEISMPEGMNRDQLRLGMSGSATAFAGNAGVIGLLASILVWVSSYMAYL